MYEQTFNFSQRPFSVCPQPEEYFPGQSHQQAIAASRSCVERRNGPATIIGAVGTGKSLTLQVIGEVFAEQFDVVTIECSRLEQRSELLQSILFGMDLPFRDMGEGELRLSLIDHLKNGNGNSNGILLLVDEADRLSIELLDELRLITNVVRDGLSQAQLVLAGTQRLEESLNDPRLASFSQRVASRSYLQNFSRDEVSDYIADQIERAGSNVANVFEQDAIDEVARSSDGCPRVINQLCERSLVVTVEQEQAKVTQGIVQTAWAELQNLPLPCHSVCSADTNDDCSGAESSDSVVEFGSLEDDQGSEPFSSNFGDQAEETVAQQDTTESESSDTQTEQYDGFEEPQFESQTIEAEEQVEQVEEETETDAETEAKGDDDADGEDQTDGSAQWGGQLPTNLGVTDYRSYGAAGAAGFVAATYGSGGDPFAPEEEAPTRQQFQYGSVSDFGSQSGSDASPQSSDSQRNSDFDAEPENTGLVDENSDGQIQPPEQAYQEQQDPPKSDDVATSSVDDQVFHGAQGEDGSVDATPEEDVRAAFDGLEQIDQARSSEAAAFPEQPSVEPAVDPFAEDFEEEVALQDAYSPFVAEQNKSSLSVTSEHLSHLQPNDEIESAEDATDSVPAEYEASASDLHSGFQLPPAASPTSYIPVQSVSTELRFPEPSQSLEPQEAAEEEIDPELAALTSDFSFEDENNTQAPPADGAQMEDGIRDQTVDMARDVRNAIDSDVSQESEDPFAQQPEVQPEAVQNSQQSHSQQPPLDESQKVLREILAQQKIVSDNQFNQPQPDDRDVDSISVEYPITDHDNYQAPSVSSNDDRDMLRVNESHYTQTPQPEPQPPTPYADAEPSTGEAQRMDYGQLFDQLRNMPKE